MGEAEQNFRSGTFMFLDPSLHHSLQYAGGLRQIVDEFIKLVRYGDGRGVSEGGDEGQREGQKNVEPNFNPAAFY